MRAITVDLTEFESRLRELLALAEGGTEVIITERDIPRALLVPLPESTAPRIPELHPGAFQPAEDFDAPLPDEFWLGQS
jgi:antitoxin (DNA-binding transcriptional repressor) of toxin-antitoxin stability system